MKLKKLYIFLMFLAALVFARLGCGIIEGLEGNGENKKEDKQDAEENKAFRNF